MHAEAKTIIYAQSAEFAEEKVGKVSRTFRGVVAEIGVVATNKFYAATIKRSGKITVHLAVGHHEFRVSKNSSAIFLQKLAQAGSAAGNVERKIHKSVRTRRK
jgi:hypothetical protein